MFLIYSFQRWRLNKEDWKEAFSAHPRIGDISVLKAKFNQQKGHGGFEGEEQAGARGASDAVLRELHALNEAYDSKFGFVFLICATGKSAEEMLRSLRERVGYGIEDEVSFYYSFWYFKLFCYSSNSNHYVGLIILYIVLFYVMH